MRKNLDLRVFSKDCEKRYILIAQGIDINRTEIESIQNKINKMLDLIIQDLSITIPDRQIPYVKIEFVERIEDDKLRVVVDDKDTSNTEHTVLSRQDVSHLLNIRLTPAQRQISISDDPDRYNAELIIDEEYLICAAVDIFLDIAMFNSYSFLKTLPLEEKQLFSSKKHEYYINKVQDYNCCFYHYRNIIKEQPDYFSFAFSARQNKTEIDIGSYIYLWNDFIKTYYPNAVNIIPPIIDQLQLHTSFYQITKNDAKKRVDSRFENIGAQLLLRINRDVHKDDDLKADICAYFGIPKYKIGALKIKDLNEYHNPKLAKYLSSKYVSAFKVIVTDDNIIKGKQKK